MKKLFLLFIAFFYCSINSNAEIYLVSDKAQKQWASIWHDGKWFTIGVNAFPDFETLFTVVNENSTVFVAD